MTVANDDSRGAVGAVRRRPLIAAGVAVLAATALTACRPHDESVQNPCPELSRLGAIAMAKLGLTPLELKQQQKC
jgi:hypothetical protein